MHGAIRTARNDTERRHLRRRLDTWAQPGA